MMKMKERRDYAAELQKRVVFIQECLAQSGAQGIVFGNSGGKDSALVGILCKKACDNVLGVMMPCESKCNYNEDMADGLALAAQFGLENIMVDLTKVKAELRRQIEAAGQGELAPLAIANMVPRLRMITLYTIAQTRHFLVAGTGNRSERYMGYFTKWGDGAFDLNPIADLTVTEIYEFLRYLNAPPNILTKAPSAGLFEGQTDEAEMGITYAAIDHYLFYGEGDPETIRKIEAFHQRSEHKRKMPRLYGEAAE
jgi:NAD+ synthase